MSNNDLSQAILGQTGQRGQRRDGLGARILATATRGEPIPHWGGVLAKALTGAIGGYVGAQEDAEDAQRRQSLQDAISKRDFLQGDAFDVARGRPSRIAAADAAPPQAEPEPVQVAAPMAPSGGVAASEARYAAVPGRPAIGATYREPAWAAGLPPATGRIADFGPAAAPAAPAGPPTAEMLRQRINALTALGDNPRAVAQLRIDERDLARLESERIRREDRQFMLDNRPPAAPRAPEELVVVQTPEGPRYVPRSQAAGMEPARPADPTGGPRSGLNPIAGYDAAGNPIILLPRTDGTVGQPTLPDGVTLTPRTREIDTGTEILTVDQGGIVLQRRPKDVAGRETQERVGAQAGSEIAAAPQAFRTATQSLQAIDGILNHEALRLATGVTSFTGALPGTPMMDFRTRVDQLQGQAFLQAFESLRGGGAITEIEGRKATDAIARLNRGVSARDFRQALQEVRDVITAGRDRAAARLPRDPASAPGSAANPAAPPGARLRFNPATGDFE